MTDYDKLIESIYVTPKQPEEKIEKYNKVDIIIRIDSLRKERYELFRKNSKKNKRFDFCKNIDDFSSKIGITRKTYSNWKNKITFPKLENILDICNALECTLNYLLGTDDLPFTKTISDVSHVTNILPEIIETAINNQDYLDFLNFFMLPDNCAELFHNIYLFEWKNFLISNRLSDINPILLKTVQKAFDKFYLIENPNDLNVGVFKKYLREFIPSDKVCFINTKKYKNYFCVSDCFSKNLYEDFKSKCPPKNKYDYFIDYIGELTYSSLINNIYLEIQKKRISDSFMQLIDKYVTDLNPEKTD